MPIEVAPDGGVFFAKLFTPFAVSFSFIAAVLLLTVTEGLLHAAKPSKTVKSTIERIS
jgi:hypothetical protein